MQRLWDSGRVLADLAVPDRLFPKRVTLRGPTTAEIGSRFPEVRDWAAAVRSIRHVTIEFRQIDHRLVGKNSLPSSLTVESARDVAAIIGKSADLTRFEDVLVETAMRCPELVALLARRPHDVLACGRDWTLLLDVVDWMAVTPRSHLYARQVDIPGVHTKLIEQHLKLLAAMLDISLAPDTINQAFGVSDFTRRYGFRPRPRFIRFRYLSPHGRLRDGDIDRDYALTATDFALVQRPTRVFITENETNYLAFPPAPDAIVVFGAGSGFDHLAGVRWLAEVPVHYWGDIDTHGFAILDQLRGTVPHAESMLMDRATLFAHERYWGKEDRPTQRELTRLTVAEHDVYNVLRDNKLRPNLRLEQERVRFGIVQRAVDAIALD